MGFLLLSTLLLMSFQNAQGAELSENLSWRDCVAETLKSNSELQAARQSLQAAQFSSRGAYSGFFPQVAGSLGYQYGEGPQGGGAEDSYMGGVSISQNLFSGFQDRAKVAEAEATQRLSNAQLETIFAKVSFELKSSYIGLYNAYQSLKVQEEIVRRREENLKLVELRFESGRENKGAVLLSKAYLNQAHFEVLQSKNTIRLSQAQLARTLGRDEVGDFRLVDSVPAIQPPVSPDFKSLAVSTPAYLSTVAQESVAEARVTSARSGFFPTLSVTGTVNRSGLDWFPNSQQWSVGAALSFPLFSGGKDYYSTKNASSTFTAATATRYNTSRQVLAQLRDSYNAFVEAVEKLKVDESFLFAAETRAEIARNKYNNGLITFDDWDIIESDLITRQKTVLTSQKNRVLAEAAWQRDQGKGVTP